MGELGGKKEGEEHGSIWSSIFENKYLNGGHDGQRLMEVDHVAAETGMLGHDAHHAGGLLPWAGDKTGNWWDGMKAEMAKRAAAGAPADFPGENGLAREGLADGSHLDDEFAEAYRARRSPLANAVDEAATAAPEAASTAASADAAVATTADVATTAGTAGTAAKELSMWSKAMGWMGMAGGGVEVGEGIWELFNGEGHKKDGVLDIAAGSLGIGAGAMGAGLVDGAAMAGALGGGALAEGAVAALGPAAAVAGLAALGNKSDFWDDEKTEGKETSLDWAASKGDGFGDWLGKKAGGTDHWYGEAANVAGDVVGTTVAGAGALAADVGLGAVEAVSGIGSAIGGAASKVFSGW